ncbi:MAG: DUF1579 family protein [Planctomycetota bacterium]
MKTLLLLALPLVAGAPFLAPTAAPQEAEMTEMAEMMKRAARYTTPGPEHALLERFVGDWDVEAVMLMGGQATPATQGTATFAWKVPNRWLESEWSGTLMGMPGQSFQTMGYDKLKQSYVWNHITTYDTAMNHAEGDLTPDGKALILYGTLDEYLTGEHDKLVKYVYRFLSDDSFVLEVHDLAIGETNTKVLEFRYARKEG